jgi:cob(I)alamin adenosyltransferase
MAIRIYTKTGDDGTTGLFGGTRIRKDALRIEGYGTLDELNSTLGVALAHGMDARLQADVANISSLLFTAGADLATPLPPPANETAQAAQTTPTAYPIPRIEQAHVQLLERLIDEYDAELEPLKRFILPGGTLAAAELHVARTICRRAERVVVALAEREPIGDAMLTFLNRLSDYLFTAARLANKRSGVADVEWVNPSL